MFYLFALCQFIPPTKDEWVFLAIHYNLFNKNKHIDIMAKQLIREALVDEIMCDLLNGMSRFQVRRKLEEDQYETRKTSDMNYQKKMELIAECFKRFALETKDERDAARDIMYARILSVYEDAITVHDRKSALQALKQLTDLQGLLIPEISRDDIMKTIPTIQISFGCPKKETEEEEEVSDEDTTEENTETTDKSV